MSKAAELAALIGSQTALSNRNLIINGAMQIAQRGTVTGVTNGYGGPDRFKYIKNGAAIVTLSQDTNVPSGQGFTSSMKFDVTTADSSIAAGEYALIQHFIEAQNLQHLKYGTTDAVKCTIQFWVKSPKTGIHVFEVVHNDASYKNAHQYTINTANTWQKVEITFDGYQTTAINNDNGIGLEINWWLAAGSNFGGGTYNENTWHNTTANRAVGQVNAVDSTSNNFYITGVQLEVGEQATAFEHRSFGDELKRCQRYYQTDGGTRHIFSGSTVNGAYYYSTVPLITPMRAGPTLTFSSNDAAAFNTADPVLNNSGNHRFEVYKQSNSTSNSGYFLFFYQANSEL